jgi:hypothetical protein
MGNSFNYNNCSKDKQKQTSEVLNESREALYGTDRPNDPLSNSMFFQFMTRLDDRHKNRRTDVNSKGMYMIFINLLIVKYLMFS